MSNKFFSLVIVPDNCSEVKHHSFTGDLLAYGFLLLAAVFLFCAFFIIGFHIKLYQEQDFKTALDRMTSYKEQIAQSQQTLETLSEKLASLQDNDVAYRKYASMDIPDSLMYLAGIGGHVLVDENRFAGLDVNIRRGVSQTLVETVSLLSRVEVQEQSLNQIDEQIQKNNDEFNSTPSILPTHSVRITDGYGLRIHPITGARQFHDAVDIAGNPGQRIYATADGTVIQANYAGLLGNCIVIKHQYGYETLYGHLQKILVSVGQEVKKGEIIGLLGSTGRVTGPHVHYSVTLFGKSVNPLKYF